MENSKLKQPQAKSSKRKIFQIARQNLTFAGISPNLVTQPYPFNGRIFMGFLILVSSIVCNFTYTFYEAKTFVEYTQSIYMASVAALIIFALAIIILKVDMLFEFIDGCENLVNATTNPNLTVIIEFEHKLSELIFFITLKLTPFCAYVPWSIHIYFAYFSTDLGTAAFELPIPMWLPFLWKNPFSYVIAIAIHYTMLSYALLIGACVLVLGIGSYLYIIELAKCIKRRLFALGPKTDAETNRTCILDQLIDFIELHSNVKHLIDDFSEILEPFLTILFLWSLVTICSAMLMIQLQIFIHHSDNLAELFITTIQVIYAFGVLLIVCELGQRIIVAFDECSEMIDHFDWYLLPAEIQRMLPIIINFAQQTVDIKCFGSVACDRETFKYMIKTAFSYFTMLRQFYD